MANFDSEFFGLVFPGLQATQKIHAQNSRPELSAFLSNFTFLNLKFIHADFMLTGETKISGQKIRKPPNVGEGACGIGRHREEAQGPLHETMRLAEARLVQCALGGSMPS